MEIIKLKSKLKKQKDEIKNLSIIEQENIDLR